MDQLRRADARYAELQGELKVQAQALNVLRTDLHALQERHTKIVTELEAQTLRLKENIAATEALQKQVTQVKFVQWRSRADMATAQASGLHLRQQLDQAVKALESANDKIERLQDENRLLGHEKAVLDGRMKQLQQSL